MQNKRAKITVWAFLTGNNKNLLTPFIQNINPGIKLGRMENSVFISFTPLYMAYHRMAHSKWGTVYLPSFATRSKAYTGTR